MHQGLLLLTSGNEGLGPRGSCRWEARLPPSVSEIGPDNARANLQLTASELTTSGKPSTNRIPEGDGVTAVTGTGEVPDGGITTPNRGNITSAEKPAQKTHESGLSADREPQSFGRRNLGKGLVAEEEEATFQTPLPGSPTFVRSGSKAAGVFAQASTSIRADEPLHSQEHLNQIPGSCSSIRSDLVVALFDGAPRKRLRSDFTVASTPLDFDLNSGREDDILRPPPRTFKSVNVNLQHDIHSDCIPFPSHETFAPLLLQCAGSCIPDSQGAS